MLSCAEDEINDRTFTGSAQEYLQLFFKIRCCSQVCRRISFTFLDLSYISMDWLLGSAPAESVDLSPAQRAIDQLTADKDKVAAKVAELQETAKKQQYVDISLSTSTLPS